MGVNIVDIRSNSLNTPYSVLFYVLGNNNPMYFRGGVLFFVYMLLLWGLVNVVKSVIFSTNVVKWLKGIDNLKCDPCCITFIFSVCLIIFGVMEFLGFYLPLFIDAGLISSSVSYLLSAWIAANFLRVINLCVCIIFRTKSLSKTYYEEYNYFFFVLDLLGTNIGLESTNDSLFEKLVTLVVEIVDAIFSFMYSFYQWGHPFTLPVLTVLSILKAGTLALKIPMNVKNYMSLCGHDTCTVAVGAVEGLFFFVMFVLLEMCAMQVVSMNPLLLLAPCGVMVVVSGLVLLCGLRRVEKTDRSNVWRQGPDD